MSGEERFKRSRASSATLTPEEPTVAATLVCASDSDLEGSAPNVYSWRNVKHRRRDVEHLGEGFTKAMSCAA